ncbi:hypothetical protein M430DRAFT_54983 [Amorphotheca resinae ATCC 22711]|uniref:Cytochrome b561 domain-containing protein n=1 Tax=Amorphotheca resinae ATCC 22711 TaxID=857342 RepID=A0A2T3BDQ7_AMORE|nr:hypothetical protein M430DRAFT_54983 [Amorphotheca resinae ATCC 22711]PSS27468.1 hypothetical protein M430DRAFT_54983 [Amorphotheca resinae ATCC 22711]
MVRLSSVILGTVALVSSTAFAISTTTASGFVAKDGSVAFALNIPQDDESNDLYFSVSGPSSSSWIAVGMGNNKMDDTLMFLVYSDPTGKNITLSPRLSYGHVEPSYTSNLTIHVLSGSGISNNKMTANAMCQNCRSWKGGSIDPTNTKAQFIYASGPHGSLKSNSFTAGIQRHASYGTFTMDLTKAIGAAAVPAAMTADTSGTSQESESSDHDFSGAFHACLMILAFVGLMPIGILILRVMNSVKWHGFNQALSTVVALVGVFLGVYCATMYNRTKNYTSAHQIFGLVITVAMIAQFVLGFMHHRIYKKTLAPTRLAPVHVWLGRLVIPCGIANGFLGFPLSLNSKYNWALTALLLLVIFVLALFIFYRWKQNNQNARVQVGGGEPERVYQPQPWSTASSQRDIHLTQMNDPRPYDMPK